MGVVGFPYAFCTHGFKLAYYRSEGIWFPLWFVEWVPRRDAPPGRLYECGRGVPIGGTIIDFNDSMDMIRHNNQFTELHFSESIRFFAIRVQQRIQFHSIPLLRFSGSHRKPPPYRLHISSQNTSRDPNNPIRVASMFHSGIFPEIFPDPKNSHKGISMPAIP